MVPHRRILPFLIPLLAASAAPADGQILDRLKKTVSEATETVDDARETLDDAKQIRCEVQGVCGEVWQSELFAPEIYQSLAVTTADGTGRFRTTNVDGLVRNTFEGQLIENGFLLAASADADAVRQKIGRSDRQWSDNDLAQLGDFVNGIDAVLVVQIDEVGVARCELDNGRTGTEATVHLSARWVSVDVGEIPWVGRHQASACADGGATALTDALDRAAAQLATALPVLE